jgi:hypothetical protein
MMISQGAVTSPKPGPGPNFIFSQAEPKVFWLDLVQTLIRARM